MGLVSPEAQLYDSPKLIGFINGIVSLAVYGIQDCEEGFGSRFARYSLTDHPSEWIQCHIAPETTPHQLQWTPPLDVSTPEDIIDEMDLLLTGGRMSEANKGIISQAYTEKNASDGQKKAVQYALSHFAVAPEFQVTNRVFSLDSTEREERPTVVPELPQSPPPVTDYKAIVYLYFAGGLDSYSVLNPHTCANGLNDQFHQIRGNMAVPHNMKLTINSGSIPQPCTTFGLHPKMSVLQQYFNSGECSFFSNVGTLVEPLTDSTEFEQNSKKLPHGLFAHNIQTSETQSVALDPTDGGVLGRIGDALNAQADKEVFDAYSIAGTPKVLDGAPGVSRPADVLTEVGVATFTQSALSFESNMKKLNKNVASSIFAETYSEAITTSIGRKNLLEGAIGDLKLSTSSETCFDNLKYLETPIALQLHQVARIMKQRDSLQSTRSAFYVQLSSFDAHGGGK